MSTIRRASKTELDLNEAQITACKRHAGAARWAYNGGLRRKQETYAAPGKSASALEVHRELNTLKKTAVPWLYAVAKCAPQEALRNRDRAFDGFFRRGKRTQRGKHRGKHRGKVGYPRCKSKKRGPGSFRRTGAIVMFPTATRLPRLGCLRLKERGYLPTAGVKMLSATVSEPAGHGQVSVQVEQAREAPTTSGPIVGVDLGVKTLATLSDGTVLPNPRHLKRRLKKLKRLQKAVTRKQKGSNNRQQAARTLAKHQRTIANQRANTLHQVTTRRAKTKSVIVIEDLNVAGMRKHHQLAQAIAAVGCAAFRRHLRYKAHWYGSQVLLASRWEPCSKTCSRCGWVDEDLTLADRVFHCQNPECLLVLERDLNAAVKLSQLAGSSSDSQNACGAASADLSRTAQVKLTAVKQEPNTLDASA